MLLIPAVIETIAIGKQMTDDRDKAENAALLDIAQLRAASTWVKKSPHEWHRLGWSDIHSANLLLYMDSLRHAAGFPAFAGQKGKPPEYDGFHRSRQSRIKAKAKLARAAWRKAGCIGYDRAFDYEYAPILERDSAAEIAANENKIRQRLSLFK
jgi:hypothetical protein